MNATAINAVLISDKTSAEKMKEIWIGSLTWHDRELWCGPFHEGDVYMLAATGLWGWVITIGPDTHHTSATAGHGLQREEAMAALETAVTARINAHFDNLFHGD
jgi:hypothetical protein